MTVGSVTPEERARALGPGPDGLMPSVAEIAAAIRDAVAAERERLLDVADAEAWALIEKTAFEWQGEWLRSFDQWHDRADSAARMAHALRAATTNGGSNG